MRRRQASAEDVRGILAGYTTSEEDIQAERDALAARVEALQRDLERAVETRENANTVSVRVEAENRALAARVEEAFKWLSAALTGHIGPDIPPGPQTFRRGEMADLEAALAALGGDTPKPTDATPRIRR